MMSGDSRQIAELGLALRHARKDRRWSQQKLAAQAGVSRASVARIEAGIDVSTDILMKITKAMELRLIVKN